MAQRKITFSFDPAQETGDSRLDRLLRKSRKISFSRLMATEPKHIKLPIPASIILTSSGEFYLFVFTVRDGQANEPQVCAKTAELFGPLDPENDFGSQILLRYGWADVQDHSEMLGVYERLDSLDVSFYYMLDLRDLLASQSTMVRAMRAKDMKTLRDTCPPWEMA